MRERVIVLSVYQEEGAAAAAHNTSFCLSEGAGGFSPLKKVNEFKGL
jgi:hypothetical protein